MSEPRSLRPREVSVRPESSRNEPEDIDHTQSKISTSPSLANLDGEMLALDDPNAQNGLPGMTVSPAIVQASVRPDQNDDCPHTATGVNSAGEIQPDLGQSPTSSQLFSMMEESDFNTMKEILERAAYEIRSLEQQNQSLTATITAKDTEHDKEKRYYADLTDRLLRQILQHEERWSQDDIAKGKLEDAARQHRIDYNKAIAQIREYQQKEPERQRDIETLNKEKDGLRLDIASLKAEIRGLERKASIASAETAERHARIADVAAINERLYANIKDKTLQMAVLCQRIEELTASRSKIEQVLTTLTRMEERSREIDLAWRRKFDSLLLPSVDSPLPLAAAYHTENESLKDAFVNLPRKVRSNSVPSSARANGSHAPPHRSHSVPNKPAKRGGSYMLRQETPESSHFNIRPRDSRTFRAESDFIRAATSQYDQDAMIEVDLSEPTAEGKEYPDDRQEKSLFMQLEELGEVGEDYSSEIYLEAPVPSRVISDASDQLPLSLPVGDQPSVLGDKSHINFVHSENGAGVVHHETSIRSTIMSVDTDSHLPSASVDMGTMNQPPLVSEDLVSRCLENAEQTTPGLRQQIPLEASKLLFNRMREKCSSLLAVDLATDGSFHSSKAPSRSNSTVLSADTPRAATFSYTNPAMIGWRQGSYPVSEGLSPVSDSDEDVHACRGPGKDEDPPEIDARHEMIVPWVFDDECTEAPQNPVDEWSNPLDSINLTNDVLTSTEVLGRDEELRFLTTQQTPDMAQPIGQRYKFERARYRLTAPTAAGDTRPAAISKLESLLTVPETVRVPIQQADNTSGLFERPTGLANEPETVVAPDQGAGEDHIASLAQEGPLDFIQILPQDDISTALMPELLHSLEAADDLSRLTIQAQESSISLMSGPHRRQSIIRMLEDAAGRETLSIAGASALQHLAPCVGSTSEDAAHGKREESPPINEVRTSDNEVSSVRSEPLRRRRASYDQCAASLARLSTNPINPMDPPPPTTMPLTYDWAEAAEPWAMVSGSSEQSKDEPVVEQILTQQPLGPRNLAGALRWHVKTFVATRKPERWEMTLRLSNSTSPLASEPVAPERLPVNDGHLVMEVEELQDEQSVIDTQQSADCEVQMAETPADDQTHMNEAGAQRGERQTPVATHRLQAGAGLVFILSNILFGKLMRFAERGYRWRHMLSWILLIASWVVVSDRIEMWYDANDNTYRNAVVRMHYEETWAFPGMEQWAFWFVKVLDLTQEVYGKS